MTLKLTKPGLLFAVALALASCETPSASPPPRPEACPPSAFAPVQPEPLVPAEAWIVEPCDPNNPPARVTPAQCAEERAATAAFLGFQSEAMEWGREGWRLAERFGRWCADREAQAES